MHWDRARQQYPDQWLLVEAIRAHSEADQRVVDDLAVIESFPDSVSALHAYQALHAATPERELYVVHSSRPTIEIVERKRLGIRAAR